MKHIYFYVILYLCASSTINFSFSENYKFNQLAYEISTNLLALQYKLIYQLSVFLANRALIKIKNDYK